MGARGWVKDSLQGLAVLEGQVVSLPHPWHGQRGSQWALPTFAPHPRNPLAGQLPSHRICSAAGSPGGCSCHSGRCSISPRSSPASPVSGRRTGTTEQRKRIRPALRLHQPTSSHVRTLWALAHHTPSTVRPRKGSHTLWDIYTLLGLYSHCSPCGMP